MALEHWRSLVVRLPRNVLKRFLKGTLLFWLNNGFWQYDGGFLAFSDFIVSRQEFRVAPFDNVQYMVFLHSSGFLNTFWSLKVVKQRCLDGLLGSLCKDSV